MAGEVDIGEHFEIAHFALRWHLEAGCQARLPGHSHVGAELSPSASVPKPGRRRVPRKATKQCRSHIEIGSRTRQYRCAAIPPGGIVYGDPGRWLPGAWYSMYVAHMPRVS